MEVFGWPPAMPLVNFASSDADVQGGFPEGTSINTVSCSTGDPGLAHVCQDALL